MKILGIDPGYSRIGYGLVESGSKIKALEYGLLDVPKISGNEKFSALARQFEKLLEKTAPDIAAFEKIYFSKNKKTAIEVAEARGIMIACVMRRKIPMLEYSPQEVKMAVTGYGASDKIAVAKMVCLLLDKKSISGPDDISDALAVAITAANRYKFDTLK